MKKRTLRIIALTTLIAALATQFTACKTDNTDESSDMSVTDTTEDPNAAGKLVNHMTDEELSKTQEVPFALLNKPWEEYMTKADNGEFGYLRTGCWYEIWNKDDYLAYFEANKDEMDPKMYENTVKNINEHPEIYNQFYGFIEGGRIHQYIELDPKYTGGAGSIVARHVDLSSDTIYKNTVKFDSYEEFKTELRKEMDKYVASGELTQGESDEYYTSTVNAVDAIVAGTAKQIEAGTIDKFSKSVPVGGSWEWEFKADEIAKIEQNVKEYHFYDAELDRTMVVHVVTPMEYDPNKTYGALVLTDAVWRFQNVPELLDEMYHNRADGRIIITVSQDYSVDNCADEVRADLFIKHRKEFLDFLTDNMMPYLTALYPIDIKYSCLFGHSMAGVFTHYAAFNSDKYENQPFSDYIIASPAFWVSYFVSEPDYKDYKNEYGYFDRHTTMDKRIFICGGTTEDADYADQYGENDSTLTGLSKLADRLESHNVTFKHQHYESNHFMYIGGMLKEWIDKNPVGEQI